MKTKAAVLRAVGGPLLIEDLEIPALNRGQVLIKVLYSGLCRSQINEIKGRKGKEFIPHLMGHEATGVVLEIGEGVQKVKKDDYVIASWIKGSGIDAPSVIYQSDQGIVNAGAVATFSEYAVVSENRTVKITAEISKIVGAIIGCAVLTGMGIVDRLGELREKKLAVFGIGGVGANVLMRALMLGAACTAVDIKDWKLKWARDLGASSVHASEVALKDFDYAIECSGNKAAMENAFRSIKSTGTTVIAGNLEPNETIAIDPFDLIKGKKLYGTWGGGSFLDTDAPKYIFEYLDGRLPLGKLISAEYPFDAINLGFKDLSDGKLIRGVIKIS